MQEKNESGGFWGFVQEKGLFIAIWVVCFIIVSVIFLVKLDDIKTNLKNTRFFERIFGSTPAFIENHVDKNEQFKSDLGEDETVITVNGIASRSDTSSQMQSASIWSQANGNGAIPEESKSEADFSGADSSILETTETDESREERNGENSASISYEEDASGEGLNRAEETTSFTPQSLPVSANDTALSREESPVFEQTVETATVRLWFVAVDADGRIARKLCTRKIIRTTSPLTNNIKLLLQGPNSAELDSGCMSLIPEGTRLLTALVKDGVAYLNFSEEFETNRIGAEGYLAQLQQIVFTSTEFATVKSVQILIDGKKKEKIGDGVWIGSPISRADFPN